jgi:calcineurin-like phosphoesterase family protein
MKFFTGSLFLGSKKLLSADRLKPESNELFADWIEYTQCLIDSINKTVGENDELYVLGNFSRRKPGKFLRRINCRHVHLIRGDIDPPMASTEVFGVVPDTQKVKLRKGDNYKGTSVILSHFPLVYWKGSHRGRVLLYARHLDSREAAFKRALPTHRSFNCCVDNLRALFGNYCPISETTLIDMLASRRGLDTEDEKTT